MRSRTNLIAILGVVLAVAFCYGVLHLFQMRQDVGDVFPEYSSLRADPLGAKALFESLDALPGVTVVRNKEPLGRVQGAPGKAFLFLNLEYWGDVDQIEKDIATALEAFMVDGGRAVIAFPPWPSKPFDYWGFDEDEDDGDQEEATEPDKDEEELKEEDSAAAAEDEEPAAEVAGEAGSEDEANDVTVGDEEDADEGEDEDEDEAEDDGEDEDEDEDEDPWAGEVVRLSERWGVNFDYADLEIGDDDYFIPAAAQRSESAPAYLPETVTWYSAMYFTDLSDKWSVLYERDGNPVVVERSFGKGSVVFSADSYFASNEALMNERHPALLAWLVGDADTVIFDEYLKGVQRSDGVMTLARKYRLHGFFAGLLVLAALLIWRNAQSLAPHYDDLFDAETYEREAGRDSRAGLINLLRRGIQRDQLLSACVEEWSKTAPRRRDASQLVRQARNLAAHPEGEQDPAAVYARIHQMLNERNPARARASDERPSGERGESA